MRRIVIALALVGTLVSQTGCAVLLTGYLIGEGMQRSKATETCRANLKATNDLRLKEGKDPFPDQCGQ